jgi:2-keto-3-deoxy-L-rhamnonate aldolase RhmA
MTVEPDVPRHPLFRVDSPLRAVLASGRPARGLFLLTPTTMLAELAGTLGFDWAVLDMEASTMSKEDAMGCVQALSGSACSPVVRVPFLNRHLVEHALDIGAHGVLVPKVDTAEEAAGAADACRFPPAGTRGVNPVRASGYFGNLSEYFGLANQRTLCLAQIESVRAVRNVDEIAAVPGVDGLFMGMGDLACAYGQPGNVVGGDMDKARLAVLEACRRHGKIAGIFAYGLDLARNYLEEGFTLLALGNDIKFFREAAVNALAEVPVVPIVASATHHQADASATGGTDTQHPHK